jgi:hypothetical protein
MSTSDVYTIVDVLNPFTAINSIKNAIYKAISFFVVIIFLGYIGRYIYMSLGKDISSEDILESWEFWVPNIVLLIIGSVMLVFIICLFFVGRYIIYIVSKCCCSSDNQYNYDL